MFIKRATAVALFLGFVFLASAPSARAYTTDPDSLSDTRKQMYLEARGLLNDWNGERDKLAKAYDLIETLIGEEPDFLPIYIERARFLIMKGVETGDFTTANQEALFEVLSVQDKDPKYPKPYVLIGHIYANLGDYENAEKSLNIAREIAKEDPWTYNNSADLVAKKGQFPRAVQYAQKALILSKGNSKALISALRMIIKYTDWMADPNAIDKVVSLIFDQYPNPKERLRIADRLIAMYSGNSVGLKYASEIIVRQNRTIPNLPEADLQMARLYLARGYLGTKGNVARYVPHYSGRAESLLANIAEEDTVRERVFEIRVRIAVGADDLDKAHRLIEQAGDEGVIPEESLLKNLGYLHFAEGDFNKAISYYEQLGWTAHPILIAAYAKVGRFDKLQEYFKYRIAMNPDDARSLSNYASFLQFRLGDIDGSIEYGERALALANYSLTRNNLGLAYLIRASQRFKAGDDAAAREDHRRAFSVGIDRDHVQKYCRRYCSEIKEMLAAFQEAGRQSEL